MPAAQVYSFHLLLDFYDLCLKIHLDFDISVHFKFADKFRKIAEYIEINTTDTAEAG